MNCSLKLGEEKKERLRMRFRLVNSVKFDLMQAWSIASPCAFAPSLLLPNLYKLKS